MVLVVALETRRQRCEIAAAIGPLLDLRENVVKVHEVAFATPDELVDEGHLVQALGSDVGADAGPRGVTLGKEADIREIVLGVLCIFLKIDCVPLAGEGELEYFFAAP